MKNKRGFTLLELLIAATIVGLLAVFATISYRNSAAEARMESARTRTRALAGAVQRFRLEYPVANVMSGEMANVTVAAGAAVVCSPATEEGAENVPQMMILCGFLENGGWSDEWVQFFVCNGRTEPDICSTPPVGFVPLACMTGRNNNPRVLDRYKTNYSFCVNATGERETFGGGA